MRIKNHFPINYFGCVRLGNLDLDFIIRISYLQSNAKSEKGISTLRFPFYCKIGKFDKVFSKIVLKDSGLARACMISKKKTAVHENRFANPFFGFQMVKRKSMKSGFGFLN